MIRSWEKEISYQIYLPLLDNFRAFSLFQTFKISPQTTKCEPFVIQSSWHEVAFPSENAVCLLFLVTFLFFVLILCIFLMECLVDRCCAFWIELLCVLIFLCFIILSFSFKFQVIYFLFAFRCLTWSSVISILRFSLSSEFRVLVITYI